MPVFFNIKADIPLKMKAKGEHIKRLEAEKNYQLGDAKITLIQCLFGIRSMRQTIPHFSTFGKNYDRRFKDTKLFEEIVTRVLEEALKYGFVNPDVLFIDATHVKANANKNKYQKVLVQEQSKYYQELFKEEIDADRLAHGKDT